MEKNKNKLSIEDIQAAISYSKLAGFAALFIVSGAVFYKYAMDLSWIDAFFFTVTTLSTIGYGDIVPNTPLTKLFTIFYAFVGIVLFIALARISLAAAIGRHQKKHTEREEKINNTKQ